MGGGEEAGEPLHPSKSEEAYVFIKIQSVLWMTEQCSAQPDLSQ